MNEPLQRLLSRSGSATPAPPDRAEYVPPPVRQMEQNAEDLEVQIKELMIAHRDTLADEMKFVRAIRDMRYGILRDIGEAIEKAEGNTMADKLWNWTETLLLRDQKRPVTPPKPAHHAAVKAAYTRAAGGHDDDAMPTDQDH